ncbi:MULTISPECIES: transglutaminase family protein [unclassified Haematobacter]|uniref:transglutaminase family protein n=1 Tax=unclassified Haematobacter TaxID=2640585 RepID=UPI0025C22134|nr:MULTISPECIES: transglutaminase family protein [unclassified Haematobacter]
MILNVQHRTIYRYDIPVRGVVQSFRLTPSLFDGQKIQTWSIEVSEGLPGGSFRDGAGDRVTSFSVRGPVSEITVAVRGTVETMDTSGVLRNHREYVAPDAYLRDTPMTRANTAFADLAASVGDASGALDLAHRLSDAVSEAIAYTPGATEAGTTAAEALALGQGVCQDQSHALITLARLKDIPARYVSGYLLADEAEGETATEHRAAHAWAELFVAGLGWVGFDAANRCCPDERYIRLGSGYDSVDAAPIRGISRGTGEERLDVTVAVQSVQQ